MKIIKTLTLIVGLLMYNICQAQEHGKFRTDILLGISNPSDVFGVYISLEPKYNVAERVIAGLRIGTGVFTQDIEYDQGYVSLDAIYNTYFMAVGDYYFYKRHGAGGYIGGGVGLVHIGEIKTHHFEIDPLTFEIDSKIGVVFRTGIETGKFRFGFEYNLIPETKIEGLNGYDNLSVYENPTITHSYFGIHLGMFIGGGKWENRRQRARW